MQSIITKREFIICCFLILLLLVNCKRSSDLENQIIITINSIDSNSNQLRINTLDTIEIRMVKFGFLKKRFVSIGEYITDCKGSVKIKIDPKEEYHISLYGTNVFGWANYKENDLYDGQEINMIASPPEKR